MKTQKQARRESSASGVSKQTPKVAHAADSSDWVFIGVWVPKMMADAMDWVIVRHNVGRSKVGRRALEKKFQRETVRPRQVLANRTEESK